MTPAKTGYRFSLYVNQHMALELGIENLNQAVVFDLLANASSWAKPEIIDGEVYYWVARQMVCAQLPFLKMKPDTAYRHFKGLGSIGLIEHVKSGKKDCVRLTAKGKKYFEMNPNNYIGDTKNAMSEINPNNSKPYVGNISESNSEINPTYKTHNTNHKTLASLSGVEVAEKPSGTAKADAKSKARLFESQWAYHPKFESEFNRIFKDAEVNPSPQLLKLSQESFCDYWLSGNNAKFKKTDWLATWRNWLRTDLKRNGFRYKIEQDKKGYSKASEGVSILPTDDNNLSQWARDNGAPQAEAGMSYADYRASLETFSRRIAA